MSNQPYDEHSHRFGATPPQGGQSPYAQQPQNPYGEPAEQGPAAGQPSPYAQQHNPYEQSQPAADQGETVLAPPGWNASETAQPESSASPSDSSWRPAADDGATVLAPAGWNHSEPASPVAQAESPATSDDESGNAATDSSLLDLDAGESNRASDDEINAGPGYAGTAAQPYGNFSDGPNPYAQPSSSDPAQNPSGPYAQPSGPYAQPSASYAEPQGGASAYVPPNQPYGQGQPQWAGPAPQQGFPQGQPGFGARDPQGLLLQGSVPSGMNPQEERSQASMAHWLGLIGWIGPLIILLTSGQKSPWVKQNAEQSLNFELTLLIGYILSGLLMFVFIGFILYPVVWILGLVFHIVAAGKAGRGENYKYPLAIQFLKS